MNVKLTPKEIMMAANVAIMRQVQNLRDGAKDAHGAAAEDGFKLAIAGALGECALGKYLNTYWAGVGIKRDADVGDVDVRTATEHHHRLMLHPEDPDDRIFYLLTGINGDYRVQGWIRGGDGKLDEYWEDPSGKNRWAYFVPRSVLNMDTQPQSHTPQ